MGAKHHLLKNISYSTKVIGIIPILDGYIYFQGIQRIDTETEHPVYHDDMIKTLRSTHNNALSGCRCAKVA